MAIADEMTAGPAAGGEAMPRQFGKYTLLRRLAAGGMAEIFLALHRSVAGFEKLIVIKRILPSMNQDQGFIEMLLHEARVAATLSHPNVVQIFDVGQVDGTYFIAMEHIHGEDIQAIVRGMKKNNVAEFPLEHTISILLGTCAGLAYAHDKRDLDGAALGIVHRDISPRNIVVSFTGDVKIVDFGIAKSGTEPGGGEDTPSGQLKGKAPYMSPEQASGQPIDWRSDIFAAGVMLFELTTGRRLFKGASEFETLKMICDKEYPLPSQVKPNYPPALERIVMRALAKKREDRYQSAREMQADLETFAREERIAVSQVSLTKWMESLFADKLAQQKEALQDVKQLADVIAAQSSLYEGGTATGTGGTLNASGASTVPALPPKKSPLGVIAAVLGLAALGGGFVYMRHQAEMQRREMTVAHDKEMHERVVPAVAVVDPPVEARGALDITTTPAGCAIWINGDLRPETTPAKIEKLPFNRALTIKLTKEGLEPYRDTVTLDAALPTKTITAALNNGSVTVLLKTDPPATVWIDGRPWKGDRTKIDGIAAGEEHKIVISASGYTPKTLSFTAQPGETKTFTETLLKADPNAPVGKPEDSKTASPAAAPAKVRVGAKGGFCNVTINGASFGATPVEATVQSGTVRISCKPTNGPALSQAIQVAPGETGKVSFKVDP
jgi:eukaryotic-like serine/threonine-protein kinase